MKPYIHTSYRSDIIGIIVHLILGIIFYLSLGALGTIGIAVLLLWIVHNYKYEECENIYLLYDIVNKKDIATIKTKRNLRKGEIICCSRQGDWYIEEVNVCFKPLYAHKPEGLDISTHDEENTFCLLKCRRIYDLLPECLLEEEQIEKVNKEEA